MDSRFMNQQANGGGVLPSDGMPKNLA